LGLPPVSSSINYSASFLQNARECPRGIPFTCSDRFENASIRTSSEYWWMTIVSHDAYTCSTTFSTIIRTGQTKCHACHAKRSNATCETSKSDPFCRTYYRHGHMALTRTVANGCGRLRTVVNVNATSSEHTLSLQTPRVKRNPCYASGKVL